MLGRIETRRTAYVIVMVADVLVPIRRQATSNHQADSYVTVGYNSVHRPHCAYYTSYFGISNFSHWTNIVSERSKVDRPLFLLSLC